MVGAQVERLGDPHAVLRVLVFEAVCFQRILAVGLVEEGSRVLRRLAAAHLELARRDERQLHADGVGDLLLTARLLGLLGVCDAETAEAREGHQRHCPDFSEHGPNLRQQSPLTADRRGGRCPRPNPSAA